MSRTVSSAIEDLKATVSGFSGAWAAWRDAAINARLAAVMGAILPRHLRFDDWYQARDYVRADLDLDGEIRQVDDAQGHLLSAVVDHVERMGEESY